LPTDSLIINRANHRSHIIGTTKNGLARIAESAAYHAEEILLRHGVMAVAARIVSCRPRNKVRTWPKLERAMLLSFREMFGQIPWCNSHGTKLKENDEFDNFNRGAIRERIKRLGEQK
jgi:hypothetical protein